MTARRILVTGVSGFVGGHLARALLARGAEVFGTGAEPGPPPFPSAKGAYAAGFDIRDAAAVRAGIAAWRPDAVIHLAALSSAARSFEAPAETFAVNVIGTWNLLEAVRAEAPAARVLLVGSGEVYGPQPEGSRVGEDAPFRPVSPYALSKAAADGAGEVAARSYGLDVVRARAFAHTGPGQAPTFVVPAWARQIARIERGELEPVLRVGNLEIVRDLTDVRDVVDAYVALIERGRAGTAYNVCRGEGVRLAAVAERLCAMARVPVRVEVDPARVRATDVPYLVGDPARIEAETGWRAGLPLARTLDDVLAAWRGAG